MEHISINNTDPISDITLTNCETYDNMLYCDIKSCKKPIYMQTPKMCYDIVDSDYIDLIFKNNRDTKDKIGRFYKLFKDFENKICECISKKSIDWFGSSIDLNTIKYELFKTSIQTPEDFDKFFKIKIKTPKSNNSYDFEIYGSKGKNLDYTDLISKNASDCVFLISPTELIISSTKAYINWSVSQILVHEKKINIKGFGIRKENTPKIKISLIDNITNIKNPKETLKEETKIEESKEKTKLIEPITEKPIEKIYDNTIKNEETETIDVHPVVDEEIYEKEEQ